MSRLRSSQISVIITTYNTHLQLDCTLRSLARGASMPCEIIVADDGSSAQTKEVVEMWRSRLACALHHIWQPDEGFRRAAILNQAIAASCGQYIVFLDGDCIAMRNFVRDHARLASANTIVQGQRFYLEEASVPAYVEGRASLLRLALTGKIKRIVKAIRLPLPIRSPLRGAERALGCNLAVWREALVAVNGLDEDTRGDRSEQDADLCARLQNAGQRRLLICGWLGLCHLGHPAPVRQRSAQQRQTLEDTIKTHKIRCQNGLDKYTGA